MQLIWATGTAWLPQWSPQICVRRPAFPAAQTLRDGHLPMDRRTHVTPVHGSTLFTASRSRGENCAAQSCSQAPVHARRARARGQKRVDAAEDAAARTVRSRSRPPPPHQRGQPRPRRENPLRRSHTWFTPATSARPAACPRTTRRRRFWVYQSRSLQAPLRSALPRRRHHRYTLAPPSPSPRCHRCSKACARRRPSKRCGSRRCSARGRSSSVPWARRGCAATARPTRRCRSPRSSGWRWRSGCASRRRRLQPPR